MTQKYILILDNMRGGISVDVVKDKLVQICKGCTMSNEHLGEVKTTYDLETTIPISPEEIDALEEKGAVISRSN